jgi:hypothetical protein
MCTVLPEEVSEYEVMASCWAPIAIDASTPTNDGALIEARSQFI